MSKADPACCHGVPTRRTDRREQDDRILKGMCAPFSVVCVLSIYVLCVHVPQSEHAMCMSCMCMQGLCYEESVVCALSGCMLYICMSAIVCLLCAGAMRDGQRACMLRVCMSHIATCALWHMFSKCAERCGLSMFVPYVCIYADGYACCV